VVSSGNRTEGYNLFCTPTIWLSSQSWRIQGTHKAELYDGNTDYRNMTWHLFMFQGTTGGSRWVERFGSGVAFSVKLQETSGLSQIQLRITLNDAIKSRSSGRAALRLLTPASGPQSSTSNRMPAEDCYLNGTKSKREL
jgi:hypothetical protein